MKFTYHYACDGMHWIGLVEADTHEMAYAFKGPAEQMPISNLP